MSLVFDNAFEKNASIDKLAQARWKRVFDKINKRMVSRPIYQDGKIKCYGEVDNSYTLYGPGYDRDIHKTRKGAYLGSKDMTNADLKKILHETLEPYRNARKETDLLLSQCRDDYGSIGSVNFCFDKYRPFKTWTPLPKPLVLDANRFDNFKMRKQELKDGLLANGIDPSAYKQYLDVRRNRAREVKKGNLNAITGDEWIAANGYDIGAMYEALNLDGKVYQELRYLKDRIEASKMSRPSLP